MIQVVVAGGPALSRAAITKVIESSGDMTVIAAPADSRALRKLLISGTDADLVLLDRLIKDEAFDELTDLISDIRPVSCIVVLGCADAEEVDALVRAGVRGVLAADVSASQLVAALGTVSHGGLVVALGTAPTVEPALIPRIDCELVGELSTREREILALLSSGQDTPSIARTLAISPLTVKTHIARMLSKLGIRQRAHLVTFAYESGFVVPGMSPASFMTRRLRQAS
ncbi:response regulator transcription factor [Streptomyces sp. 7R007]